MSKSSRDAIPTIRRVYPEPASDVPLADAYRSGRRRATGRPWVMATMVASVDGTTTVDGTSGGLGNRTDAAVLSVTRSLADVIIVGARTVRAERYGPPRTPGTRIGVISRHGDLDTTSPLFTSGAGFLILPTDAPAVPDPHIPVLRAGTGRVDLHAALARIGEMAGDVAVVQSEGGPTLNAALADADCIDELNLTLSPRLAGGDGLRVLHGAEPQRLDLELLALLVDDDGYVFSRWQRR